VRERFPDAVARRVPQGWEDAWRAFHRPIRIGRLWIGPPWQAQDADPDALAVVIDPGRAFGTGAHPTTRLALELIQGLEPSSLVDLGCGSGVLAIAAARLGYAPVVALDLDPAAVEATRVNAAANDVSIDVEAADVHVAFLPAARVAVANIALGAIEELAPRLRSTYLVASGYLARETPRLPGWERGDRREADGWAADLFLRAASNA
jgi:ribosomal protein L11 methyltransferase